MSTCNFAFDNVLVAVDCDNWDQIDYDFFIDNLRDHLDSVIDGVTKDTYEGQRSYPGTIIFSVPVYGKLGLYREIDVVVRSGYYSGLNLDYIIGDLVDYEDERKTLETKVGRVCRKLVKEFKKYGTELKVAGRFSNGEAVYEKK